ncbi:MULTISPECIES: hypothetical protein [unclassified Cupriavidus]|uniref:hypothetical protein n=1 Tax=unclassified Cupriavidus TaxID=2640874 RepID=UPI00313D36B0
MNARPDTATLSALAELSELSAESSTDAPEISIPPSDRPGPIQRRATSAPIYYRLPDTPEGHHIKEYASGLRQLVRFVGVEEQVVKYSLS